MRYKDMFNLPQHLTTARARLHASIDEQCAAAQLEIAAMAKQAMKDIRRSASFDNRSAGQRKRTREKSLL